MVFPSVPAYLDPPSWNNQQGQQPRASGGGDAPLLPVGPASTTAAAPPDASSLPSSSSGAAAAAAAVAALARPNSMAERARLARMPQPETALKCPRCDSTNTKFCYYNNYSLSQPRHFCKACRRYWTRGGTLRNVPVGGGCRRNKRSSKSAGTSSSSKPSSTAATRQLAAGQSSTATPSTATGVTMPPSHLGSFSGVHLPFLGSAVHQHPGPNLGLAFSAGLPLLGMQHINTVDQFPVASGGGATIGASLEQWRVQQQPQQFPFLTGGGILELPPPPMYQLGLDANNRGGGSGGGSAAAAPAFTLGQTSATTTAARQQEGSMKPAEESSKGQDMRQYMAALRHGSQGVVWDGNAGGGSSGGEGGNGGSSWPMNIPGFNSSSAGGGNGSGLL